GASTKEKDGSRDVVPWLLTPEHVDGANLLAESVHFRLAFADFLKSGLWIEKLMEFEKPCPTSAEERLARERKSLLYLYKSEEGKFLQYKDLMTGRLSMRTSRTWDMGSVLSGKRRAMSSVGPLNRTASSVGRAVVAVETRRASTGSPEMADLYGHAESALEPEQLRSLMIHIGFPIFLRSNEYRHYLRTLEAKGSDKSKGSAKGSGKFGASKKFSAKFGSSEKFLGRVAGVGSDKVRGKYGGAGEDVDSGGSGGGLSPYLGLGLGLDYSDDSSGTSVPAPHLDLDPFSKSLQTCMCSCAAFYDEDDLAEATGRGWLGDVCAIVEEVFLGITVHDTSQEGCPIVYANRAYEIMTGYSRGELQGGRGRT
ncbi:hypothetical protein B484DRAFT_13940, partial [Ochromonadaceae sp. CCMP2298]